MSDIPSCTAVIYTDGSAILPSGACGGGAHGYLYTDTEEHKNGDRPSSYIVSSMGYLEPHERPGANNELSVPADTIGPKDVPFVVKPDLYYNAVYPYGINGTNNIAELAACIDTINIVCANAEFDVKRIIICTDSMYVINVHKGIKKHLPNRPWTDGDRPNVNLWNKLADTLEAHPDVQVDLKKVKAHGTAIGNNVADRLAYAAREMAVKGINEFKHLFYKGKYWKDKPVPHPMLNFKQVFFNTGLTPNTDEYMYVIMDHPKDVELGKKSPEPIFGVTVFKDPAIEIEAVTNMYVTRARTARYMSALDLRVLNTQVHKKMTELLGVHAYSIERNVVRLLGETPLVTPINPPGLARNAMTKTLDLYKYINMYRSGVEADGLISIVDITEQLYTVNAKGKIVFQFQQNIVGAKIKTTVDDTPIDLTLVYGLDVLTCNQMKRLAKENPKVSLLFVKRPHDSYEYITILDCDGALGAFCNYYTNKLYLKK